MYLNREPPRGGTSFPVGTILVKVVHPESDAGTLPDQIFAMAKRGGDFNDGGAAGWEWFELNPASQSPIFIWRGAQPPPQRPDRKYRSCNRLDHNSPVCVSRDLARREPIGNAAPPRRACRGEAAGPTRPTYFSAVLTTTNSTTFPFTLRKATPCSG